VEWWKEATGWSRLLGDCTPEVEPGLEAYQNLARAEACRPSYATSWRAEADQFWHSADEAAQASCCGDLPLLVISQDPKSPRSPQAISVRPIWNNLQEHLKALSSRSWRVIARDSGHAVMIDRPDVVIRGVRQVVACTIPQGCDRKFGSTSVE
jgi:hypothetical protein